MRNAGVRFPWAAASSRPLAHFLIFKKGDFTMQSKKINPEKTKNPEVLTLDSTYRIGNRSFIVEPVFKEESSQTLGEVLLRLMKSESEKL
jgi:hypothetical protein